MSKVLEILNGINGFMWSYVLIVLLIAIGLYFSVRLKFVQFRYIKKMIKLLVKKDSKEAKKGVSSFQAFCISTASRVGTGNLAGVAIAISVGGPGAVFWMWFIALIGSVSTFVECTLAQIFKVKDKNGELRGGPAYYMQHGLGKRYLGVIFSISITIAFGFIFNSVQSNTISMAFNEAFGVNKIVVGAIITVLTVFVIYGGVNRIAKVTELIVPVMATAYVIVALIVIGMNITKIPSIVALIFKDAFGMKQFAGGFVGSALMYGIKRGLFSNEAGMGSAPNAAATAEVEHPVHQGLLQTLGVFTDTILICSATAFIILSTDVYKDKSLEGIQLTQKALSSQLGPWASVFIALCIFLFAYSSILGNYYYGESNISFITKKKVWMHVYRILVIVMVMMGSLVSLQTIWDLADLFMGFMAILNLVTIFMLFKIVRETFYQYEKQVSSGEKVVFIPERIKSLKGKKLECWD